jgi:hypothetical protein
MPSSSGTKNYMPTRGGAPTGMFSSKGSQKKDPTGGDFKPSMTAKAMDKPRKGPHKNMRGKK